MKPIASTLLGLSLLLAAGCRSPGLTKSMVQTAVSTGVGFGVIKEPRAIPYLRAAVPVVCSAAAGTNLSPAQIVAALEKSSAEGLKTPEAVIIMNGVIGIYTAIFEAYGADIKDRPYLKAALEGTCEGMKLGLPTEAQSVKPGAVTKAFSIDFDVRPHIK